MENKDKTIRTGEPEEKINFTQTNPDQEFDTLNGENKFENSGPEFNITGDASKLNQSIPGANHPRMQINLDEPGTGNNQNGDGANPGNNQGAGPQPGSNEPFNTEYKELPKKEKDASSEQMAGAIIHGYANLKLNLGKFFCTVSEKKVNKWHLNGEINKFLRIRMNPASQQTISIEELFKQHNEIAERPFQTSEEFAENVFPLLVTILSRRGIALTPEQLLGYYVTADLLTLLQAAVAGSGEKRDLVNAVKEACKQNASGGPSTPNAPSGPAPIVSTPAPEPKTDETKPQHSSNLTVVT